MHADDQGRMQMWMGTSQHIRLIHLANVPIFLVIIPNLPESQVCKHYYET